MRKDPTVSIRISAVLAERIAHLQKDFKSTKGINALAEYALESMVEMLEAEESVRRYPDILLQIDAVRGNRKETNKFINSDRVVDGVVAASSPKHRVLTPKEAKAHFDKLRKNAESL